MTAPVTPLHAGPTARVLVLDPAGRVLLLRHDGGRRAWISPGGAVEAGESRLADLLGRVALAPGRVDAVAVGRAREAA
jgi:8-oxo-dGTP pyrophosphatase MutT (NUDIX family)